LETDTGVSSESEPVEKSHPAAINHIYVLRIWQDQSATIERPALLRFSLENPKTNIRRGFTSFEALVAFLKEDIKPLDEYKENSSE